MFRPGTRRAASFLSSAVHSSISLYSNKFRNWPHSFLRESIRLSVCRYSGLVFHSAYASRITGSALSTVALNAFCTFPLKYHCTATIDCASSTLHALRFIRRITAFRATSRARIVSAKTLRLIFSSRSCCSSFPICDLSDSVSSCICCILFSSDLIFWFFAFTSCSIFPTSSRVIYPLRIFCSISSLSSACIKCSFSFALMFSRRSSSSFIADCLRLLSFVLIISSVLSASFTRISCRSIISAYNER